MKRVTRRGVGLILTALLLVCLAVSCSVTRSITTQQAHMKNGDTIAVMTTKTIETYKATKDVPVVP